MELEGKRCSVDDLGAASASHSDAHVGSVAFDALVVLQKGQRLPRMGRLRALGRDQRPDVDQILDYARKDHWQTRSWTPQSLDMYVSVAMTYRDTGR